MTPRVVVPSLLLVWLLACCLVPTVLGASSPVEQAASATVLIHAGDGQGTGFIINASGYIITCYHVVQGAGTIDAQLASGRKFGATLLAYDTGSDLALLKVEAVGLPKLQLGSANALTIATPILALGYPLGQFSVTRGIVSSIRQASGGTVIQVDAAVNPGNSGGPLITEDGTVVGVVFSKADAATYLTEYGFITEGIAFAVPINVAQQAFWLSEAGIPTQLPPRAVARSVPVLVGDALGLLLVAEESYDPDGSIVRYEWDFGADGEVDIETTEPVAFVVFSCYKGSLFSYRAPWFFVVYPRGAVNHSVTVDCRRPIDIGLPSAKPPFLCGPSLSPVKLTVVDDAGLSNSCTAAAYDW